LAQSPGDIGELFATEATAHGPVLLAGTGLNVASGSQVAAGKSVATLRLARGGDVRLCPNSSVTVSAVQNTSSEMDQELMFSMDTGFLELDYPLNNLADTLVTPDFKFMLAGPGVFHFAVGVNNQGDTCIRPLRGNSASIIVTEMLGSGIYQVKPDEALIFAGGRVGGRGRLEGQCGCSEVAPVVQAEDEEQPKPAATETSETPGTAGVRGVDETGATERSGPVHMEVQVPMVFHGDQPEPAYTVARIKFSALPNAIFLQEDREPIVLKPGKQEASGKGKEKKGFLGKIKGFFGGIFH
jgi:hypothetical protein